MASESTFFMRVNIENDLIYGQMKARNIHTYEDKSIKS